MFFPDKNLDVRIGNKGNERKPQKGNLSISSCKAGWPWFVFKECGVELESRNLTRLLLLLIYLRFLTKVG